MKNIRYNFWGENRYTNILDENLTLKDRKKKIKYISAEILKLPFKKINWLDIGTGDGTKIKGVVKELHKKNTNLGINLFLVEPNNIVIKKISKNLGSKNNISIKVINEAFSTKLLHRKKYHCISLFHSTYEIARNRKKLKTIYKSLYDSLNKKGLLLIQEVCEGSDFNKLRGIQYISNGENTLNFFNNIWPNETNCKSFPTRIKIKNLIKDNNELIKLYKFVTQKDLNNFSRKESEKFLRKVKKISKQFGEKDDLDFRDLIISIHKGTKKDAPSNWIGISGTWKTKSKEVRDDVSSFVKETVLAGNGIITGGATGVDYFAIEEALKWDPTALSVKIVLPSTLENYISHLKMWAKGHGTGDPSIDVKEMKKLINQLKHIQSLNPESIIEASKISPEKIDQTAYYQRNTFIVKFSDELVAFQLNKSGGTHDAIEKARKLGKKVIVNTYNLKEKY